jgi:hypothetical protein
MRITYGQGFDVAPQQMMRQKVETLQQELSKLPQYQPETKHYFHGGMYCREVFRHAGVLVVGAVHKKEHFYLIVSGTVQITDGEGNAQEVTGPHLFQSKPGTKRAVYAVTDTLCMTFHATESKTVEEAEAELVEVEPDSMYSLGNQVKHKEIEVQP